MKFLLLNKSGVIIDVVDTVKYVKRNENNLVVLCSQHDAQGYIGSDNETIYNRFGVPFRPDYTDIAHEAIVEDDVAATIVPRKFKYVDGAVAANEDPYPEDNFGLTVSVNQTVANLEYVAMMANVNLEG